jgi:hypothetical protein
VLALGLVLTSGACADDPNLVGWWKFDEGSGTTVADSSGAGHNGTFAGGSPQWVEGVYGMALRFDADQVEIPDHDDFHFQNTISMGLWMRPEADQPSWAKMFIKQRSGEYPYALQYNSSQSIYATVNASTRFNTSPSISNFPGEWAHMCFTYDASALILYKDGEEAARVTATGALQQNDLSLSIGGRTIGSAQNFLGIIDDVRLFSRALTPEEVKQIMTDAPPLSASSPDPANGVTDTPRNVVLSWTPIEPANTHDVYLGVDGQAVADADASDVTGIYRGRVDVDSYSPDMFGFGETHYWRVDEVSGPPDNTVLKGEVWSFTTELFSYPVENIIATASSLMIDTMGPERTIDGSGLNDSDLHSTDIGDMWLTDPFDVEPAWILYEFDGIYKLHEMRVWNQNQIVEGTIGYGFRDVTIEHSDDGVDFVTLGTTHEFAQGTGSPDYASNTTIDMAGMGAKYVRLTANSNWGGWLHQFGLSEVRFLHLPVRAGKPHPDSEATDVDVDVTLGWRAGREAAEHNVYVSADEQAVIDGTAPVTVVTETGHSPSPLDLGSTYYWRVDEVNDAETPTTWQGDIWSFSTQEFLVVDDFESYNDIAAGQEGSNLIYLTWADGFDNPSANGSTIGYTEAFQPSMETDTVHGGDQSVPLQYNNATAAFSEVTLTLASQNWTDHGIRTLSLWFFGDPTNVPGQLYVKINGVRISYDGAAGDLTAPGWQLWNIDLASVGTNLQSVTSLAIGVEGSGATGILLLDDIVLYRSAPEPPSEWRIIAVNDDAEEAVSGGSVDRGSSDLELGYEGGTTLQTVGCRWVAVPIPGGATITEAWVQFSADSVGSDYHVRDVSVIIEGELPGNAAAFSSTSGDISGRSATTAQVVWDVPRWTTVHAKGPEERTPDISGIIQEIVNHNSWAGTVVLMFRDNPDKPSQGTREAESFDGSATEAPLLHISYQ